MFGVASIRAIEQYPSSTITTAPAKSVPKHNPNGIISTCGGLCGTRLLVRVQRT